MLLALCIGTLIVIYMILTHFVGYLNGQSSDDKRGR